MITDEKATKLIHVIDQDIRTVQQFIGWYTTWANSPKSDPKQKDVCEGALIWLRRNLKMLRELKKRTIIYNMGKEIENEKAGTDVAP